MANHRAIAVEREAIAELLRRMVQRITGIRTETSNLERPDYEYFGQLQALLSKCRHHFHIYNVFSENRRCSQSQKVVELNILSRYLDFYIRCVCAGTVQLEFCAVRLRNV